MGMTIDEAISRIDYHNYIHQRREPRAIYITEAFRIATSIMRKYQKITKILNSASYTENGTVYSYTYDEDTRVRHIREVIKDGRLIDIDVLFDYFGNDAIDETTRSNIEYFVSKKGTVEVIPKANVYKAIQEMMKYEHEGFINISLTRLDEILKKCGVCEDEKED